ncbi:SIR2 family protein [Subsaximicrobium wynnwilliamsii]|jgi:NAD-dependent SIR2 family protein deacetylase|uniref:SIR2 family protein n=1 Tax=Subsaximicrobium wynnwilliamsii TaxID=291179 RepID=A0A5C6ZAS7_9FLAO|nr:SIR2 family protein [Subsaximicrobium wynnwilliamsii]TXD80922.1 SIR2 family protein [Subsaximicrobium wynnwilliamsii]TXD86608.1 SIR2 family protein [Subsaximicrobium wynnwilliamsii]TXE00205.1 SIR2 family protein [Subsaximicrobium wynnwilliamsii]
MEKEDIYKQLQTWTNNIPLIILGSGASVPFRLPSMWALGEHIKTTIKFADSNDQIQFEEFIVEFDKTGDLESTLTNLQLRPNVLAEIVNKTWQLVSTADLEAYEHFIKKDVDFPLANLLKYFLNTAGKKVSIITTNYDRLAEYASSLAKAIICNGYSQNLIGHFSNSIQSNNLASLKGYTGQVNIWKVHGSLDWFKSKDDVNIQLPNRQNIPEDYSPLIVTPGLSKYSETHNEPYRTIFTQADSEIEQANGFLCIGYGFNDIHVQPKLITQIKNKKPIIVITKELTSKTKQSIIDNKCHNYMLIEEANSKDTRIFSSKFGEVIIEDTCYWELGEYLKLIIS